MEQFFGNFSAFQKGWIMRNFPQNEFLSRYPSSHYGEFVLNFRIIADSLELFWQHDKLVNLKIFLYLKNYSR